MTWRFVLAAAKTWQRVEEILNNLVVGMTIYKDAYSNWFNNRRIIPLNLLNSRLSSMDFAEDCAVLPWKNVAHGS